MITTLWSTDLFSHLPEVNENFRDQSSTYIGRSNFRKSPNFSPAYIASQINRSGAERMKFDNALHKDVRAHQVAKSFKKYDHRVFRINQKKTLFRRASIFDQGAKTFELNCLFIINSIHIVPLPPSISHTKVG